MPSALPAGFALAGSAGARLGTGDGADGAGGVSDGEGALRSFASASCSCDCALDSCCCRSCRCLSKSACAQRILLPFVDDAVEDRTPSSLRAGQMSCLLAAMHPTAVLEQGLQLPLDICSTAGRLCSCWARMLRSSASSCRSPDCQAPGRCPSRTNMRVQRSLQLLTTRLRLSIP